MSRASKLFDRIIVAVSSGNSSKNTAFDLETRVSLVQENLGKFENVSVESFNGLLVDYAKKIGATVLIRGLRAVSDFEYEFQMAQMNRHLNDSIETVYLMPTEEHFFTSSNLIKQVFKFTDREKQLIPENVHHALVNYYKNS